MKPEDHVGDVLGKVRSATNVSLEAASRAAGFAPSDYQALEETGGGRGRPDYQALGKLLGLHAEKLRALADGWAPEPIDVARWHRFIPIATSGSGMEVNCYLAWDEETKEAALFDTGFDAQPILKALQEHSLKPRHLFITHAHHDHVAGLNLLRQEFPDLALHSNSPKAPPGERNQANQEINVGKLSIDHRDTPGHADDGVTYVISRWPDHAPQVAVVGDALFAGSMGGAGHHLELAKSWVRKHILSLPPDTLICPGHGPLTTVSQELAHNPFF